MVGIDKDDLVVLVNTVLVHPVRVEDPQVTAPPANTLLRNAPEATLGLELGNTLTDGLAVGGTLGDVLLAVTAADTDAVDHVALLGLVAEAASLVGARGAGCAVDNVQLAVFPATIRDLAKSSPDVVERWSVPNAKQEAEDVRLLLLVELADVLVRTHGRWR